MTKLYISPSCTSCRKALAWFDDYEIPYIERNIFDKPLTTDELKEIMTMSENGTEDIISTRSKAFKALNINIEELTLKELFTVIQENPEILKRPIILDEKRVQVGYNEDAIRRFLPRELRAYELQKAVREAGVI